jgi:hypothetical protein
MLCSCRQLRGALRHCGNALPGLSSVPGGQLCGRLGAGRYVAAAAQKLLKRVSVVQTKLREAMRWDQA